MIDLGDVDSRVGAELPAELTYCDITMAAGDVVAIDHMTMSEYSSHPCYKAQRLEAYVGAPVVVDGAVYGALSFSSPRPAPKATVCCPRRSCP